MMPKSRLADSKQLKPNANTIQIVIKFVAKVGKRTIAEGRTGQKLVNRKKMSAIFLRLKKTVEK
mgnify:CR=1 FL=1